MAVKVARLSSPARKPLVANWASQTLGNEGVSCQSPLKTKPLRTAGEPVADESVQLHESALIDHQFAAARVLLRAFMEWFGYLTHSRRYPRAFTILAARWRTLHRNS